MSLLVVLAGALVGAATRRSDAVASAIPDLAAGTPRSVYLALAMATLAVLIVLAAVVLSYMRPDEDLPAGAPVQDRRHPALIVLAAVVPAVLIIGALLLTRIIPAGDLPRPPTGGGAAPSGGIAERPLGLDDVVLPVVAFFGAMLVTALIARHLLARAARESAAESVPAPETLVGSVAEALDDGLEALLAEPDPRRAVIVAYARMERAMAKRGWARRPSEAPTEYVSRVLSSVPEQAGDVAGLTELYVFARFSPREITAGMRGEAIELVRRLRSRAEGAPGAV